jgi:isoaspartyl peptidase/L-asparaginase-like protein (Ntn-hydrolase superfamily)
MTISRRSFLGSSIALAGCGAASSHPTALPPAGTQPVIVATWSWGRTVCERAQQRLSAGASLLDAIETGINAVERDPNVRSVGVGGRPNAEGIVQLDAMMMVGSSLEAGSVCALERIATPISVARRVMERTRHVCLVGAGALEFARQMEFAEEELLTETSRTEWEAWRASGSPGFWRTPPGPPPTASARDHDTVGAIGIDGHGEVIVGLSTSGLEWKLPGRVGDSPIVGAGGYADAEVGAACATGVGEEVIRVAGSHSVVERMRAGMDPQEAVEDVLRFLRRRRGEQLGDAQVAMLAVRRDGVIGAACLRPGFELGMLAGGAVGGRAVAPLDA